VVVPPLPLPIPGLRRDLAHLLGPGFHPFRRGVGQVREQLIPGFVLVTKVPDPGLAVNGSQAAPSPRQAWQAPPLPASP
jgi:hypothetical protein